jgi:hypothetical protein
MLCRAILRDYAAASATAVKKRFESLSLHEFKPEKVYLLVAKFSLKKIDGMNFAKKCAGGKAEATGHTTAGPGNGPVGKKIGVEREMDWYFLVRQARPPRGSNNHRRLGEFPSRLSDRLTGYLSVWAMLGHLRGFEDPKREIPSHSGPVSPGLGFPRDRGPGCPPPGLHG